MTDRYIIRTSERKDFKNCRQKWDFAYRYGGTGMVPQYEDWNLAFGTALHAGWEAYYDPKTWHIARTEVLPLVIVKFHDSWKQFKQNLTTVDEFIRWQEMATLGVSMLHNYAEWAPEHDNFDPIGVEIKFEVPIRGILYYPGFDIPVHVPPVTDRLQPEWNIFYQGKIDVLLRDRQGGLWIMDHKSCSSIQSGLPDFLPMDEQIGSYCWAIGQELGVKIEGFLYNEAVKTVPHPPKVLKNGSLSKDKSQNTNLKLYLKAIRDNGLDPEPYHDFLLFLTEIPNKYFRRTQVQLSPRRLQLIGDRIRTEAVMMLNNPEIVPNPNQFMCGRCQYKSPCDAMMDGSDPDWILKELYEEREPNEILTTFDD